MRKKINASLLELVRASGDAEFNDEPEGVGVRHQIAHKSAPSHWLSKTNATHAVGGLAKQGSWLPTSDHIPVQEQLLAQE